MGIDIFGWIRRKARDAVLGGISDAVLEVSPDAEPADLDRLRALLAAGVAKQLAAANDEDDAPAKGGRRKA